MMIVHMIFHACVTIAVRACAHLSTCMFYDHTTCMYYGLLCRSHLARYLSTRNVLSLYCIFHLNGMCFVAMGLGFLQVGGCTLLCPDHEVAWDGEARIRTRSQLIYRQRPLLNIFMFTLTSAERGVLTTGGWQALASSKRNHHQASTFIELIFFTLK